MGERDLLLCFRLSRSSCFDVVTTDELRILWLLLPSLLDEPAEPSVLLDRLTSLELDCFFLSFLRHGSETEIEIEATSLTLDTSLSFSRVPTDEALRRLLLSSELPVPLTVRGSCSAGTGEPDLRCGS